MHQLCRASLYSVCAVLVMIISLPAIAQWTPSVDYAQDGSDAIVRVNSRVAVRFKVENGGLTTLRRAEITAGRLKPLASGGWKTLSAKTVGSNRAQVMAGDQLICIATEGDAKANNSSALALAQSWAKQLRWLFSLPPVSVTPVEITVPENETRTAIVGGAAQGPIVVTDSDPNVAASTVDPAKRAVVILGKSIGRSTVSVSCQGCRASLVVNVRRYAARLIRTETAEVTGNPAPDWLLSGTAAGAAPGAVALEPGATALYGEPRVAATLARGENTRVLVPVKASGQGLISVNLLAPVEITNRLLSHLPPNNIFYSNNPERVTRYGVLFTGKIGVGERKRLLYHHQNMLGKRARFSVELINAGMSSASVQSVSGISRPLIDTVVVGYLAGRDFLRDYLNDVGRIYVIPPRSRMIVYAENLEKIETASGIMDLRQLSGGVVYVRVKADPPAAGQPAAGNVTGVNDAYVPTELSQDVFSAPTKQVEANYVVGDRWAFIRIGKDAIRDDSQARELYGNYGVIYRINVHVENPTAEERTVRMIFEPTAGPAGAIFVLGGKIIGVKIVVPPNEFEIGSVRLGPGQSKDLTLLTMPISGSAYPATLVVR